VHVKVGAGDGEAILAMLRSDDGGQTWTIPYADATLTMFQPGGGFVDLGSRPSGTSRSPSIRRTGTPSC